MAGLTPKIITGNPAGTKARPRADFKPTEFDHAVTTKGYRMYWSRGGICPCANNDQTEQPNINCPLCKGNAYYWFLPDEAISAGAAEDSHGNPVVLNEDEDGVLIWVLMTSLTQDVQVYQQFGEWVFGGARATTQAENKLGYRDRLVAVDSLMTWAQVIEYDGSAVIPVVGGKSKAGLRYPFIDVHQFRSVDTVFRTNSDFRLTDDGTVEWLGTPPSSGTRLSIHGTVRPVWIVLDHMHTYRDTPLEGGTSSVHTQKYERLPVQAMVKLDFLVEA